MSHSCPRCLDACSCTPLSFDMAYLRGKTECRHVCTKEIPIPQHPCVVVEAKDLPPAPPCPLCGVEYDRTKETENSFVFLGPRLTVYSAHIACLVRTFPRSAFSGGRGWKDDRVPTLYTTEGYQERGGAFTPYQTGDVMVTAWGTVVRVDDTMLRRANANTTKANEQLDLLGSKAA